VLYNVSSCVEFIIDGEFSWASAIIELNMKKEDDRNIVAILYIFFC
jgi:hypothetical protein